MVKNTNSYRYKWVGRMNCRKGGMNWGIGGRGCSLFAVRHSLFTGSKIQKGIIH